DSTARAGIDFLRLDHHVGMTDWLTASIEVRSDISAGVKPNGATSKSAKIVLCISVRTFRTGIVLPDCTRAESGLIFAV
ncbi:hypothetical protein AB9F46_36170, partial [Rhizobium leguminosarum]|uniref:hypothetical protein n=1 Tax=Rhizobium leguminosarum TaxID=384 RepID=UPI003F983428